MKCEDALALIEEYFDGELRPALSESIGAHVARCNSCREILESLEFEQEAILRAHVLPEPSPSFWTGVEARIAAEKVEHSHANPQSRRSIQGWFSPGWFTPAFASAVLLVLFGAIFGGGILRNSISNTSDSAIHSAKQTFIGKGMTIGVPVQIPEDRIPADLPGSSGGKSVQISKTSEFSGRRPENDTRRNPLFGTVTPQDLVAINNESRPDEVVFQPASFNAGDPEISRHFERVSTLMRSFRNARLVGDETELAFERKTARDLLSQNMFLRRNAEASGDTDTLEVLNTVEPILLDIANLDMQPTKGEVNTIKDRIEKDDIVAALQVR